MSNYFFAGGRLYWRPINTATNALGEEVEIGTVQDISITSESQTVELLSRDNGPAEVVAEAVLRRDYTLAFTTGDTNRDNLARFLFGSVKTKTYVAGDTYRNGKTLSAFSDSAAYVAGDTVIEDGAIYEAIGAVSAGTFDADEWKRLGSATVNRVSASTQKNVVGQARFVSANLEGTPCEITIYKVSLSPSGDLSMIGQEFRTLVFTGKIQRTAQGVLDYDEDVA
ncbi:MAG: hypothetical protein LBO72_08100 [Helicobacteraceae bacterium]|jgi:hypothetical protein|nr:hypothetical protein [Helicobacteraceae bacterium]